MRKLIRAAVFLLSLSLIACTPSNNETGESEQSSLDDQDNQDSQSNKENDALKTTEFPDIYIKNYDGVHFNTEIIIENNQLEYSTTYASLQKADREKAYDMFFGDRDRNLIETYERDWTNEKGEEVTYYTYVIDNSESVSTGPISSRVSYTDGNLSSYARSTLRMSEKYDGGYNAELFTEEQEFSFASSEEAFQDIEKSLLDIGIDIGDCVYEVYYLDHETLQQEELHIGMDGNIDKSAYKDSWSEEDDCYYFCIRQKYEGLAEYHIFVENFRKLSDENAPIQVLYSKNGIISLDIEKVFNFQDGESVSLCDFEKVAETVAEKYNMLLSDVEYEVTKAELYYVVDITEGKGEYFVTPGWIIEIVERLPDGSSNGTLQMEVNAVTGEEIR